MANSGSECRRSSFASRALKHTIRVVIGLFVCWQIFFLLFYNSQRFLLVANNNQIPIWIELNQRLSPDQRHRLKEWVHYSDRLDDPRDGDQLAANVRANQSDVDRAVFRASSAVRWWARKTAHEQSWALFAPNVLHYFCFPAVELRWDDDLWIEGRAARNLFFLGAPGALQTVVALRAQQVRSDRKPVVLDSDNQPADFSSYSRVGGFRLRRFESLLDLPLIRGDKTLDAAARENDWNYQIRQTVDWERLSIRAYLRHRLLQFQQDNPNAPPPTQVRLVMRTWTICPPDGPTPFDWKLESEVYVARWLPHRPLFSDSPALEHYNVLKRRFRRE